MLTLPSEAAENVLLQLSTNLSSLAAKQRSNLGGSQFATRLTTAARHLPGKTAAALAGPSQADGKTSKSNEKVSDTISQTKDPKDSDVSSMEECVDLTISDGDSDSDRDDPDYSRSEDDSSSESLVEPGEISKSPKTFRLGEKTRVGINDRFPANYTKGFRHFLGTPAGGLKSNVREVDSAVSRCLHFIDDDLLEWSNLLKLRRVSDWLAMHASFGDGPSALLNKIYYVQAGLKYLRFKSKRGKEKSMCSSASRELDSWKVKYRKLLKKRRFEITDAMCSKDDDKVRLQSFDATVNDPQLRSRALGVINQSSSGNAITRGDYLFVMRYCLTSLSVKNAKRPGVLTGMTLPEWKKRTTTSTGLKLVLVKEHKTYMMGTSHVYVESTDEAIIDGFINHIRPQAKNASRTPLVFITFSGTKVKNVSCHMRKIFPAGTSCSATAIRKAYATSVGELGDLLKEKQVAELSDHSHATQQKFYAAKKKAKHTAEGYETLRRLRHDWAGESSRGEGAGRADEA